LFHKFAKITYFVSVFLQVLLSMFKVAWNLIAAPFLIRWTRAYLSGGTESIDRKVLVLFGF
jgi:hypothetical protein